jgi:methionyl-tRNA formyltransferase
MSSDKVKLKIVFLGSAQFGAIVLGGLIKASYKPALVITTRDKMAEKNLLFSPEPIKNVIGEEKINLLQPKKLLEVKEEIEKTKPDFIIFANYISETPKEIIQIPKHGCLNVHPSLLPRWRGPYPVPFTILNEDRKTGATITLIEDGIDRGPILAQRTLNIKGKETAQDLSEKLANIGTDILMEIIPRWIRGVIIPKLQNEDRATYSTEIAKEDGRINWKKTAQEIEKEIRAFNIWPGSYTFWKRKGTWEKIVAKSTKITILKARVLKSSWGIDYPIGKTLVVPQNEIAVQCGKGFFKGGGDFLVIEELQLGDEKPREAERFLADYPGFSGAILK